VANAQDTTRHASEKEIIYKTIHLTLTNPRTGDPDTFPLPIWLLWHLYEVLVDPPAIPRMALAASFSVYLVCGEDETMPRIEEMFNQIAHLPGVQVPMTNRTDVLLSFTYGLLQRQQLSHIEAAQFASSVLGERINPDAWRMRLNRWSARHGLPPVGARRGRPPAVNPNVIA
jgi:hypothetical protein